MEKIGGYCIFGILNRNIKTIWYSLAFLVEKRIQFNTIKFADTLKKNVNDSFIYIKKFNRKFNRNRKILELFAIKII